MPSLSEAEEAYTALPGGRAGVSHLQAERQRTRMRLSSIARLEQVTLLCLQLTWHARTACQIRRLHTCEKEFSS